MAQGDLLGIEIWRTGRRADHEGSSPPEVSKTQLSGAVAKHDGYEEPRAVLHDRQHQE